MNGLMLSILDDFCRVVLDTSGEEGSSDYINACYVEVWEDLSQFVCHDWDKNIVIISTFSMNTKKL